MAGIVKYHPKRTWAPLTNLMDIHRDMDEMFDAFFSPFGTPKAREVTGWYPSMDVFEDEENFTLTAELPGLCEKDIHITMESNTLSIEGERKEEKETKSGQFHKLERKFGSFCRSFQLPTNIKEDKISAHYEDGILKVDIPKLKKSKPKHIEIKVT